VPTATAHGTNQALKKGSSSFQLSVWSKQQMISTPSVSNQQVLLIQQTTVVVPESKIRIG
jgi:hypothetical protein